MIGVAQVKPSTVKVQSPKKLPSMPELPEVEHSRRLWQLGQGAKVLEVIVRNGKSRVFRSVNPKELVRFLSGQRFFDSETLGKQLLFRFGQRANFG